MTPAGPCDRMIVIVASAGGVEALKYLVAALPEDLPAAVVVSLHLAPTSPSLLPGILARRTRLTVVPATDGLVPVAGTVIVARPDVHLVVEAGGIRLGRGPAENNHRPSHDVTMRSAALAYGPRLVGVVLTGLLDDGAAGLGRVARYGGACLVQDPDEAEFPSMPLAALRSVPEAARLRISELPTEMDRLVRQQTTDVRPEVPEQERARDLAEVASGLAERPWLSKVAQPEHPARFACPDCCSELDQLAQDPDGLRFRCRTGHGYTVQSLLARQDDSVEEALQVALRALEDREELSLRLAQEADATRPLSRTTFVEHARIAAASAEVLRHLLTRMADGGSPQPEEGVSA